jgi:hypothetical protein
LRSRMRTDSSMLSSSKGFMLCFTPAVSIAVWALFTRGLTCFYLLAKQSCLGKRVRLERKHRGKRRKVGNGGVDKCN